MRNPTFDGAGDLLKAAIAADVQLLFFKKEAEGVVTYAVAYPIGKRKRWEKILSAHDDLLMAALHAPQFPPGATEW